MRSERDWGSDVGAHSHVILCGRGITAAEAAASNTTPAGCLLPLNPCLPVKHTHTFPGASLEKSKRKKLRNKQLKSTLKIQLQKQPSQRFPYSRTHLNQHCQPSLLHLSASHLHFLPLLSSGTYASVWHFGCSTAEILTIFLCQTLNFPMA